ncbi:MAG: AmmeMemoRadiSam system radical SAM enzyme [Bacteroidota bacterium]|nr:AmmeMemoRadiSam system radical SAM enzyme [Bacteroidota bacterium]
MKTREAEFYHKTTDGTIICDLCPHHCVLKENKISPCGSRIIIDGKLHALSYGNIVAQAIDPIEKKPLYHFLPGEMTYSIGTPGCNLHCKNCQNSNISQSDNLELQNKFITPEQIVRQAKANYCSSISYTYSEPTIFYEFMLETAQLAHKEGLKNIMVSNGYICIDALQQLLPYLDAVNIDMKGFSDSIYKKLTGGYLNPVLSSILAIKKADIHMEITILCIPGMTDDAALLQDFTEWMETHNMRDVPLHLSRFFPSYKLNHIPACSETKLYELIDIAKEEMFFVYPGNVSISETHNLYCYKCGELLISRTQGKTSPYINNDGSCPKCGKVIIPTYQGNQIR